MLDGKDIRWDSEVLPEPDLTMRLLHELEQDPERWPDALAEALEQARTYRALYLEAIRHLRVLTVRLEQRTGAEG